MIYSKKINVTLDGLTIGNGTVYNFIDYIGQKHITGGILKYTASKGYCKDNLINNYNGGLSIGRYGYGSGSANAKLSSTDGMRMDGDSLVPAATAMDSVGDVYSVDNSGNGGRMFTTEEKFEALEKMLRDRNLQYAADEDAFNRKYIAINGGAPSTTAVAPATYRGDTDVVDTTLHGQTGGKDGTILEHSVGYIAKSVPNLGDGHFSHEKGHWKSKYGIKDNSTIEHYSVSDINARKSIIKLDREFSEGSLIGGGRQNSSYVYFEEEDMKAPVTNIKEYSTSDGFVPSISSHSSSSYLLRYTNGLFKNNTIKSLINRFHTEKLKGEDTITAYDKNFGLSRGRNLLRKEYEGAQSGDRRTGFDNPYCRVWTAHHQYSKLKDRIRPFLSDGVAGAQQSLADGGGGLRPNNGHEILGANTVLQNNGYLRISPQHDSTGRFDGIQKYMFSIENLAWRGSNNFNSLKPEQQGPNGGRIMWFPPYNLKFSEQIHADWNANAFIGRGEKIYTYKDTERGGQIDFTLLIDHPSIINKWRGTGEPKDDKKALEKDLLRYFAGCGEDLGRVDLNKGNKAKDGGDTDNNDDRNHQLENPASFTEYQYIIFFPNDFSADTYWKDMPKLLAKLDSYEISDGADPFVERDGVYESEKFYDSANNENYSRFGLNTDAGVRKHLKEIQELIPDINDDVLSYESLKRISKRIKESGGTEERVFDYDARNYEIKDIEVRGYASQHGHEDRNKALSEKRRTTIQKITEYVCSSIDSDKFTDGECLTIAVEPRGDQSRGDVNVINPKIARSAVVTFRVGLKSDAVVRSLPNEGRDDIVSYVFNERVERGFIKLSATTDMYEHTVEVEEQDPAEYTYDNEYLYFEKLEENSNLIYKNIVDKIKYFDPAFHSMTPEGFNARLAFLHQCTRQGPTVNSRNGGDLADTSKFADMAANLSFGRAPYCILRIGDFFHTKICITSINITYDNNGIQWDLNPEGAGVQPMMANVSMSFNFLGGQDITGTVERLQNAVSQNFYANESVYNRASIRNNKDTE